MLRLRSPPLLSALALLLGRWCSALGTDKSIIVPERLLTVGTVNRNEA
jgi:hypothetical protein